MRIKLLPKSNALFGHLGLEELTAVPQGFVEDDIVVAQLDNSVPKIGVHHVVGDIQIQIKALKNKFSQVLKLRLRADLFGFNLPEKQGSSIRLLVDYSRQKISFLHLYPPHSPQGNL